MILANFSIREILLVSCKRLPSFNKVQILSGSAVAGIADNNISEDLANRTLQKAIESQPRID